MIIRQILWNILKYKAFLPGFVIGLFLVLMLQDMLSEKSAFVGLTSLKVRNFAVKLFSGRTNFLFNKRPLAHWRIQGAAPAPPPPPPPQDQFLSFSHTFSPKSVCVGGWHPPTGQRPPNGKSWIRHCISITLFVSGQVRK